MAMAKTLIIARSLIPARGVVLLELLLAMTLFLTALLPMTRFLVRTAATDRAADVLTAVHLARQRLERLRRNPRAPAPPDTLAMNDRVYYVHPAVLPADSLFTLAVRVYRGAERRPLVELITRVAPPRRP